MGLTKEWSYLVRIATPAMMLKQDRRGPRNVPQEHAIAAERERFAAMSSSLAFHAQIADLTRFNASSPKVNGTSKTIVSSMF